MARQWVDRVETFHGEPRAWLAERWAVLMQVCDGFTDRAELLGALALAQNIPLVSEMNFNPAILGCPSRDGACVSGWWFSSFPSAENGLRALRLSVESNRTAANLWRQGRWEFWRVLVTSRRLPKENRSVAMRLFFRALEFVRANRPALMEQSAGQVQSIPTETEWMEADTRSRLDRLRREGLDRDILRAVLLWRSALPRRYRTAAVRSRAVGWLWGRVVAMPWGQLWHAGAAPREQEEVLEPGLVLEDSQSRERKLMFELHGGCRQLAVATRVAQLRACVRRIYGETSSYSFE